SSEVHAFGGLFTSLLAETLEVARSDLGRPAYTSFGAPFGLIPPLENAITSAGAAVEDSWAHHLADAEEAAVLARDLLAAAQTEEIRAIREVRQDAVDRESAEVGALESLAAICGSESTESGCSFPGHANTTLRELGLVDAA